MTLTLTEKINGIPPILDMPITAVDNNEAV